MVPTTPRATGDKSVQAPGVAYCAKRHPRAVALHTDPALHTCCVLREALSAQLSTSPRNVGV